MIRPSQQWAFMIDITNACPLHCSNCTRMLDHARTRYFMEPEVFARAVASVADFPYVSEPCPKGSRNEGCRKTVWMIGGEPLLHPRFPELVDIMCAAIPDVDRRGLGTSADWQHGAHPRWGPYRPQVERLIGPNPTHNSKGHRGRGYLNWNQHTEEERVHHQPVLVAAQEAVADERHRWELIEACWVQERWSAGLTPKGFFFCEMAGEFDMIFDGPGGLPFEPGVWRGELRFEKTPGGVPQPVGKFAEQIKRWCPQCGACLPLPPRRDKEARDDISPSNLATLRALGSPRVRRGEYVLYDPAAPPSPPAEWAPFHYVKGKQSGFAG